MVDTKKLAESIKKKEASKDKRILKSNEPARVEPKR